MINSWSLLYDELYGDDEMTEDNTITPQESDEYDPKPQSDSDGADWNDPIITVGSGNTAADKSQNYYVDTSQLGDISIDTSALDNEGIAISGGDAAINFDRTKISTPKNIPVISSVPKLKETERCPGGLLKVIVTVTNASVIGLTRVLQRSMEANLPKYIEF